MRKEVLIAIILGFALGLVITFGIWSANKALREKENATPGNETETITTSAQITPTPTMAANTFSLAIVSPEDESYQTKDRITVSGSTDPGINVVIISEKDETVVQSDASGKFEAEVNLANGTNEITVAAMNNNGDEASKTLEVVYTTAAL